MKERKIIMPTSKKSTGSTGAKKSSGSTASSAPRKKSTKSSSHSSLEKFKMEAASEMGITLKSGYNGDLTSRQAGSIGGRMVKKMVEQASGRKPSSKSK